MKESKWQIVYTRPDRERKVAELFAKKGFKAYCPFNKIHIKYGNRKKIIEDTLFISYVFVCLNENQESTALQTKGVLGFVYWLDKRAVIQDEDIAAMKLFLDDHPQVILEKTAVSLNDHARIMNDPLIIRKGNVVEIRNTAGKVSLPSLGYTLVADMQKENSEAFIYREESRVRV